MKVLIHAHTTYSADGDQGMIIDALEGAVTGAWPNLAAFFNRR